MSEKVKKMTPMKQSELMGLMPFRLDAEHEFTPAVFKDRGLKVEPVITVKQWDNKSVNKYKNITLKAVANVQKALSDLENYKEIPDDTEEKVRLIEDFVVGWLGFVDAKTGDEVEFSKELIATLPVVIIDSIVEEIAIISGAKK